MNVSVLVSTTVKRARQIEYYSEGYINLMHFGFGRFAFAQ
jgi:hypothetical protein